MPKTVDRYSGTRQERIAKRQKDIDTLGAISKAVESRTAKKQVQGDGTYSPKPEEKKREIPLLGEQGRGIIYHLKARTQIEENKHERLEKKKK